MSSPIEYSVGVKQAVNRYYVFVNFEQTCTLNLSVNVTLLDIKPKTVRLPTANRPTQVETFDKENFHRNLLNELYRMDIDDGSHRVQQHGN